MISGAAVIEAGVAGPSDPVDCGMGSIQVGRFVIHDAEHERFGVIPLSEVIAKSSNVGMVRVGLRLGPQRLYDTARSLGIGVPTGIDLPGENGGLLRDTSRWSGLSNAEISFGQEVSVTPIQLAVALSAVANGGFRVRPRMLRKSVDASGREWYPPAAAPRRVLSASTAAAMNAILKGVVSEGTGKRAAVPGYVVAGKTGTAQKAIGHGYARDKYVATFAGYAPADHPRLVLVVTVDEPRGQYFASEVAAPIFSRILARAMAILEVPPDGAEVPAPPAAPPIVVAQRAPVFASGVVPASLGRSPSASPMTRMPDLSGLPARTAMRGALAARRRGAPLRLRVRRRAEPPLGSRHPARNDLPDPTVGIVVVSMKLEEIIEESALSVEPASNPEISSVVSDSRRVTPGALFVAIAGERADGFDFAADAARLGAAAVASDRPRPADFPVPWVRVADPRRAAAVWSQRVLGDPWKRLVIAGVTGTNGKTTTAMLLAGIFRRARGDSGFIGTVGYGWKGTALAAPRTTPEGDALAQMMAGMVRDGVRACAMEVSSHAIALERVAGIRFDAAVFTNLTRDHLDFHGTMEEYGASKERLFALRKAGAPAVVNVDDPWGRAMAARLPPPVVTFSPGGGREADWRAEDVRVSLEGTRFVAAGPGGSSAIESPLVGRFHVENLLAAWAAARALGVPEATVAAELAANPGAPGRMERVEAGQPYAILVDYAHTEDALRRLLSTVREMTDRTIILVFGCGGDRDRGKREPMGRAAAELSDIPIATSDNPRGEDPAEILKEVERGLVAGGASKYLKFVDRREAIGRAIELANSRSVVVIAGKGHETTQTIGGREYPFDDRVVAAECVRAARRVLS